MSLQDTNVPEPTPTLAEYLRNGDRPIFGNGVELTDGSVVYRYVKEEMWSPPIWSQVKEDNGEFKQGDVVWKDNRLQKVASVKVEDIQVPLEPEEYGAWDDDIDYTKWKERYFRVSAIQTKAGWMPKSWKHDRRWYYMFWEDRGKCFGWRWSAKDMGSTGTRHYTHYLRTCLAKTTTSSFEVGSDIPCKLVEWKGRNSNTVKTTIQFQSIIERNGYFYFRTNLDLPIRYKNPKTFTYSDVTNPKDINGFRWNRLVAGLNPLDGKNYTKTVIQPESLGGYAGWTLLTSGEITAIAFGHIIADFINIKFLDGETGLLIDEVLGFKIDNSIDYSNPSKEYYATFGIYTKTRLPSETIVQIEVYGEVVEVGEIMAVDILEAGFTSPQFKNNFRDFSPKEQDQWGNIEYRDGVRVQVHKGTVDLPMLRYDQMNRLLGLLGGGVVFIDGSDATLNQSPDGKKIFEATQMIGRFTALTLQASPKDKHIGDKAKYSFDIEEIV